MVLVLTFTSTHWPVVTQTSPGDDPHSPMAVKWKYFRQSSSCLSRHLISLAIIGVWLFCGFDLFFVYCLESIWFRLSNNFSRHRVRRSLGRGIRIHRTTNMARFRNLNDAIVCVFVIFDEDPKQNRKAIFPSKKELQRETTISVSNPFLQNPFQRIRFNKSVSICSNKKKQLIFQSFK